MSVLLETSKGDVVIDLFCDECPIACKNFLKLCKTKYYNYSLFHKVVPGTVILTGDPTGTGTGGSSIYGELYGEQARFFEDEIHRKLRHEQPGCVSMANTGPNTNASQFFITAAADQTHLDDKYTLFGMVAEGLEVVQAISNAYADADGRPYQNIRIRHTIILDDPFDDPPGLQVPDASPGPSEHVLRQDRERLADGEEAEEEQRSAEEIEEALQAKAAASRAQVLEMLGDIPDADIPPPDNVLFVCKLNPVTEDEDLDLIFGRFGEIKSCQVIRDYKTGDSLNYAFVEFEDVASCTQAYFKMDGALIDDRRIKVDFSQSVSKLWNKARRREAMPSFDANELKPQRGAAPQAGAERPGDWRCSRCGASVFASKDACFKCKTPRSAQASRPTDGRSGEGSDRKRGRDGDRGSEAERLEERERHRDHHKTDRPHKEEKYHKDKHHKGDKHHKDKHYKDDKHHKDKHYKDDKLRDDRHSKEERRSRDSSFHYDKHRRDDRDNREKDRYRDRRGE